MMWHVNLMQESCQFEAAGCIGSSMIDTACLDTPKVRPRLLLALCARRRVYKAHTPVPFMCGFNCVSMYNTCRQH